MNNTVVIRSGCHRSYIMRKLVVGVSWSLQHKLSQYSHRRRLEVKNAGYKMKRDFNVCEANTKTLISFASCVFASAKQESKNMTTIIDFRSGSEAEPHEFTKEPPCVDRKTVIKPTVIEKVEQLRQIRHLLNKHDVSSSEEDAEQQQQQRSLSVSFGKHVDFAKGKSFEPVHEKKQQFGFRPCPTQTGLYNHRRRLDA